MTEARTHEILRSVERTGQVPEDTTLEEMVKLDDCLFREGDGYQLTTLGEMEIE